MIHKKYFKIPLNSSEFAPFMVWTADGERAFDFCIEGKKDMLKIVDKLNGNEPKSMKSHVLMYDDGYVYADGHKLLFIRSWGRLTGTGGGLGLSSEKASEIQDSFGEWIIDTLLSETK